MGDIISMNQSNASDIEMLLDLDTSDHKSTLRRCSTFTNPLYPVAAATAARLIQSGKGPKPRRCSCQNYDPVYSLWKNGFENEDLLTPGKVLPMRGKNRRVYDITGVLAGQKTPKGFPYFTDLRKQLHDEEEFTEKDDEFTSSYQQSSSLNSLVEPQSATFVPDPDTSNERVNSNFEANEASFSLKKAPKRLSKNSQRSFFNSESKAEQRHFIELHDLGACYYAC